MEVLNYARMCHLPTKLEPAGEEESELELPRIPNSTAAAEKVAKTRQAELLKMGLSKFGM